MKKLILITITSIATICLAQAQLTPEKREQLKEATSVFLKTGNFDPIYLFAIDTTVESSIRDFQTASGALWFKQTIKDRCLELAEKMTKFPNSPIDLLHVKETADNMYELVILKLKEKASKE